MFRHNHEIESVVQGELDFYSKYYKYGTVFKPKEWQSELSSDSQSLEKGMRACRKELTKRRMG